MKLHAPFPRHTRTRYIRLSPHDCQACWTCVAACPQHVLGKVEIGSHRHAHVDHADACKGCKTCVRACPHHAIEYTYQPVPVEDRKPPIPRR